MAISMVQPLRALLQEYRVADHARIQLSAGALSRFISFIEDPAIIEKILRHLKLWNPPTRPPPPRASVSLEMDADFLAWKAASRLFDGID
jgi:hypothetical protein